MNTADRNERAAAVENAAAREIYEERRAPAKTGQMVTVAFGKKVALEEFLGLEQFDHRENPFLAEPEMLLASPKPGWKYGWPKLKDPNTQMKIRTEQYHLIGKDDLKSEHGGAVTTHQGVNGSWVMWYGHVLVGIPPRSYDRLYTAPLARGQARLATIGEDFQGEVERKSGGMAVGKVTEYKGAGAAPDLGESGS